MVAVLLWADEDREPNARIADNKRVIDSEYNVKYKYTMKSKVLALILLCGAASLGAKVKLPALDV